MSERKRIQDDLYDAVNGDWMDKAVIPSDRPVTGGFSDLDQDVEKLLMEDFVKFSKGEKSTNIPEVQDAIRLYNKILDAENRNKLGIEPVKPLLDRIKNIRNVNELNEVAYDLLLQDVDLPFNMFVSEDMQDATKNSFIVLGPSIILPDTAYYDDANPAKAQLLQIYSMMVTELLKRSPLSEEEQKRFLEGTLKYDALVAKSVKSQLEWADYVNNHNPMSVDEVANLVKPFDLKGLLRKLYGEKELDNIIVYDPRAIKEFHLYFNDETFESYIQWAYVKTLLSKANALSLELNSIAGIYRRALMGVQEEPTLEKQAYRLVSSLFSEPIGVYYGREYFGEEAKKDIVSLVHKIIDTYKLRMARNNFLEESTKEKAILKLSTIVVKMGYPDKVDEFFSTLKVNEEDSLYDALARITTLRVKHLFGKLLKPVNREEWLMPGHMVNACYNPSANDITFPAAILQKPFYSIKQSISENLGGIGAVIGHEISHAFDNNGAHFDEHGNLANWWSESDFEAFKDLTQDMVEQFDGLPFHGGKVSGQLTVSENIADNGGMGVTLEIMSTLDNPNYQEYFKNWARVWCQKASEQYIMLLLNNDVHSPAVLRANMQPRNFQEWYDAFDIKESDQMYIAPEKRISIW